MVSPETAASSFTKAEKSTAVIGDPPRGQYSTIEDGNAEQQPSALFGLAVLCGRTIETGARSGEETRS
jgi:hypothetical protein